MIVEPLLEYLDAVLGQVAAPLADSDEAGRRAPEGHAPREVHVALRAALIVVGRGCGVEALADGDCKRMDICIVGLFCLAKACSI